MSGGVSEISWRVVGADAEIDTAARNRLIVVRLPAILAPTGRMAMARVFFSYSHADEALRDRLEKALAMLRHEGLIESWHDRRIIAGDEVDPAIDAELEKADVILLLVSPDFLASRYCFGIEVRRAMERHRAGAARVIPIILRPCEWDRAPFAGLLATPRDGKPVTKWPDQDEAFLDATRAIRAAVEAIVPHPAAAAAPAYPGVGPALAPEPGGPRSSNLRLRKEFTEADRDRFLDDTFNYIRLFFENSLQELGQRHAEITAAFRAIDANRFTAVIYRQGRAMAHCLIRLGRSHRSSGEIQFSHSLDTREHSYNESLRAEHDDQGLFLKTLGMQRRVSADQQLSFEGAAEYYWSLLIEPLQR